MLRLLSILVLFAMAGGTMRAEEIGFVESFALAKDRAGVLQQLIPGTEDYYYYHCLHAQNLQQYDKVTELLAAWIKRYDYTPRVREIQYRQALLTYPRDNRASLEFIRLQMGLEFNHQREQLDQKPNLPVALDQQLIHRELLARQAFARYQNLQGFEDSALDALTSSQLNPDQRRNLLERLTRPDAPNLPRLVVDDLNHANSGGFGSLPIHRQLLVAQLEECVKLKPDLLNQTNLVYSWLAKLHPSPDIDWEHVPAEQQAYLDRLWAFVSRLEPVHNSLKAHVLYQRLEFDRGQGKYDQTRFLDYIRLPRNVGYINAEYMKLASSVQFAANLNQDFRAVTLLPPVGDDEPLVRSYLQHFFQTEATFKAYEPYLNDLYLKHTFAETKIVNGLGDAEQWYAMLPPEVYQQLKERIDLDFAPTNKRMFGADEPISLDLSVKNVSTLLVKVHSINTLAFYRQHRQEVNTDINLDGLVANFEATHAYSDPPLRRISRHFDFPELKQPGVYVIDFIGNGKSSRVVVRKGKLRYVARAGTSGHVITVFDESNQKVNDAALWMDGHEYQAGPDGLIRAPFSNNPGYQPIVLSRGEFASLAYFQQQSENYGLVAGIHVDRESLLTRRKAQVVVRPGLYLNGVPVTLSVLEQPQLIITSVDHDGVPTTKEVPDFKLFEDRESVYEFNVPGRLAQITFTLKAKVQNLSQNHKVDLAASETLVLNQIDKTEKVDDLHLARYAGGYVVELLGRSGEPKRDRPVALAIKHRDFRDPVQVTLKTDARGRVDLGPLTDIASVTATGPQGTTHAWTLPADQRTYSQLVHSRAGDPIELPFMGPGDEVTRADFSLLEIRGGVYADDHFSSIGLRNGLLTIRGLPRGDHELLMKRSGARVLLRVAEGELQDNYVLASRRYLEIRADRPLQIAHVRTDKDDITIRLVNATPHARVHVFATRYLPAFSAYEHLGRIRDAEPLLFPVQRLESLYAQGRNIGDEYRYILDRRFAKKFPGNMLERPGLLLNPWAIRSTETEQQLAEAGEAFAKSADQAPPAPSAAESAGAGSLQGEFANLDFLAEASAVLLNLVPDAEGRIAFDRKALGAHQHLHVVAVDPRSTVYRSVSLAEVPNAPRDLRLANGLNSQQHFTQQKQISILAPGDKLELADITTARFETYDSLARVYSLYLTLSGDATLAEFGFLLKWPDLTVEQKREKYSKYACHELNFFLLHKDPEFFENIVRPYLENKRDKTFLDRWLTGEDLTGDRTPWNFERLNIVERILMAQRIGGEREYTSRHVRELYDLLPPNVERAAFLFGTALKGSALDEKNTHFDVLSEELRRKSAVTLGDLTTNGAVDWQSARGSGTIEEYRGDLILREPQSAEKIPSETAGPAIMQGSRRMARPGAGGGDFGGSLGGGLGGRDAGVFFEQDRAGVAGKQLYQQLDKTQEWVENNYYHLPIERHTADLVTANAFWNDYAAHDGQRPFFSRHVGEASRSFTEMMFALAVLDLPFRAGEHVTTFQDARMTLQAASPLVVFHEEIRPAKLAADKTPLLVSQNFFRQDDRYRHENNLQYDKFVTDEFLVGTVYGCQVIVTNPTSSPMQLDVLLQVPLGAIPVLNGQATKSVPLTLQPFNTQTVEHFFYFPAKGKFAHFPVHVAKSEELLASATPFEFNVVDQLSKLDTESWDYISQHGNENQVLDYLKTHNLQRTNLERMAWRMQDANFFRAATELLSQRHAYHHTLWSYSIHHNVPAAIREFLQHADGFVAVCGEDLDSPLLSIDPVARKTFEFREFKPLVNARAHQLGKIRTILNGRMHEQYHRLMKILSYRRDLNDAELMAVTYYLLLQDRVDEALGFFGRVNPGKLATQVQYDYCAAYLSFYSDNQQVAREMADKYVDFPVDHWRRAFETIDNQLDEIRGGATAVVKQEDRTQQNTQLAATEPGFELKVEARKVRLDYQNLAAVQVNFYLMDIELMFSTNPFVQQHGSQFAMVRPNHVQRIELPAGQASYEFELPESLRNRNVLVEAVAAGQTRTQAYYSNSLNVQVIENYGQVRVTHEQDQKPLAKVYVKVYARRQDGSVQFYKDGYTDLRGRFDYTALNTNDLDFAQRFSILVLSDELGAEVREASPPKR